MARAAERIENIDTFSTSVLFTPLCADCPVNENATFVRDQPTPFIVNPHAIE
jgi:hypothetical protein